MLRSSGYVPQYWQFWNKNYHHIFQIKNARTSIKRRPKLFLTFLPRNCEKILRGHFRVAPKVRNTNVTFKQIDCANILDNAFYDIRNTFHNWTFSLNFWNFCSLTFCSFSLRQLTNNFLFINYTNSLPLSGFEIYLCKPI